MGSEAPSSSEHVGKGLVVQLALHITRCARPGAPDMCYRKLPKSNLEMGLTLLSDAQRIDFVFSRLGHRSVVAPGHIVLTFIQ